MRGPRAPITVEAIDVMRGPRAVLRDVSIVIAAGQMTAVSGPSGAGKSTLLAVLAEMIRPNSGSLDGLAGLQRALVLQTHGLVAVLSAVENVELALQVHAVPRAEISIRAERALHRVGLDSHLDRLALELSGGQQQRVGVARALVVEPDLLLADEPTAELDPRSRELVLGSLREEATRGAAVVIASHDPDVIAVCDQTIRLDEGRVVSG